MSFCCFPLVVSLIFEFDILTSATFKMSEVWEGIDRAISLYSRTPLPHPQSRSRSAPTLALLALAPGTPLAQIRRRPLILKLLRRPRQ